MGVRNAWLGVGAVVTLAGLDLLGAYLAKEFSVKPRWIVMVAGLAAFGLLFFVYVKSLALTDLWVVTFGWVVLLEVGVLVLDRLRFDTHIPTHKMVLAGMIVILQVGLMLPSPHHSGAVPNVANSVGTVTRAASPRRTQARPSNSAPLPQKKRSRAASSNWSIAAPKISNGRLPPSGCG
ncbi:MAG: hypothetical protein ABIR32_14645 [Ilumatobacteraceae bacterium]